MRALPHFVYKVQGDNRHGKQSILCVRDTTVGNALRLARHTLPGAFTRNVQVWRVRYPLAILRSKLTQIETSPEWNTPAGIRGKECLRNAIEYLELQSEGTI